MIVDAGIACEAAEVPAQAAQDLVRTEPGGEPIGAHVDAVANGLHRHMQQKLMSGAARRFCLTRQILGIGHEGKRDRRSQGDRPLGPLAPEPQIIDDDGNARRRRVGCPRPGRKGGNQRHSQHCGQESGSARQ